MIYVSMRRGGRFLYAFDVTDPGDPVLAWRTSSAQIPVLGQTWSEPRLARVRGHAGPVLVMGAGYDTAEDALPAGATTMGNAVLVLDAMTGALVRQLDTERSVAASVALMDVDYDGYVDRAYAADVGGNVYRIDFESSTGQTAPAIWTIGQFAALDNAARPRKFFYAPDLVQTNRFVAVMLGSGNRERPLLTATDDRFYTLFDYRLDKGAGVAAAPLTNDRLIPNSPDIVINASVAGCYLAMDRSGEKVVTASVSTGGFTYFSTNRPVPPSPTACVSGLGVAKGYRMPLFCGASHSIEYAGGGLPPSPVTGEVMIDVPPVIGSPPDTPNEQRKVPFIIGGVNVELSGLAVSRVPINVDPTRRRLYWYTQPSR
jgi:type IV pilus assembly protein PilY1